MLHSANDRTAERIDILTKAIGAACTDKELTKLYIERGHCYESLNDDVNSVRDYLSGLDTAETSSDKIHLKSMIALALAKKDQKEQAIFWALGAVDEGVVNAEGYHTLGLVSSFCGFLNLAVDSLQRAVALEPHRWEAVRSLGSCLRDNGQVKEAIEVLSRYVENNPDEPLGLYELGWSLHVCLSLDNHLQAAKEAYEKAMVKNPGTELRTRIERKLRDIQVR